MRTCFQKEIHFHEKFSRLKNNQILTFHITDNCLYGITSDQKTQLDSVYWIQNIINIFNIYILYVYLYILYIEQKSLSQQPKTLSDLKERKSVQYTRKVVAKLDKSY